MNTAAKRQNGPVANHCHGTHCHGNHCQGNHGLISHFCNTSDNDAIQVDDSMQEERNSNYGMSRDYDYSAPPAVQEKMRRELKFFFMNPYEKYKARGRKPWKLGVQIIKIILVTLQLIQFGMNQFRQATFFEDNEKAFNNIFLKDWDPTYDSFAYPKTRQLYALYLKDDVYEHMDYAVYKYSQLEKVAVGTYEFETADSRDIHTVTLCNKHYSYLNVSQGQFDVNLTTKIDCLSFQVSPDKNISMKSFLRDKGFQMSFDSMIELTLKFSIRSLHVKDLETLSIPDCVRFNITILYDYSIHGGRIAVSLSEKHSIFYCANSVIGEQEAQNISYLVAAYDVVIMLLCTVSLLLCFRSLHRGRRLKKKAETFFQRYYDRKLSRQEKLEFLNMWYIMIILSDLLTISGSLLKLLLEWKVTTDYDACSLLLGTGCFLVWLGVLRYLGFFPKYNIPIITLKNAMPNCIRFIVCGIILYMAYGFSGWIVLGPYHHKFRSFNVAIECMYSLINGDDMFATFDEMSDKSTIVWIYSRLYLYSFISLFIYVILSLFIALIMDTYETVKACHGRHRSNTPLEAFIDECNDCPESGCYRRKKKKRRKTWKSVCCCRRTSSSSDEATPLLH
ncbi:mucolipin-3-like isoform X2 [Acanthaster planci]|nr:mucolipin-3-like isoform X2 [Acanthaster planci]